METISGRIHSIIYHNPDNGYTVAEIDTSGGMVSATGVLFSVAKGESIVADGDWYQHPKYGNQFKIAHLKIDAQPGGGDITAFLSSGLIKGLGEKKAALLVERFGDNVFDVMENDFSLLTEINGIGVKTAQDIHDSYMAVSKERDTVVALTGYGLTVNTALKLFEVYGANAVRVVESNPYRLIEDVAGIGFARADDIAMKIGIAHDSSERIRAGIIFILHTYINMGHVYAAEEDLVAHTARSLGVDEEQTEAVLHRLLTSGRLVLDDTYEQRRVYAAYMYEAETRCAEKIAGLLCARSKAERTEVDMLLERFERDHKIKLDDMQRRAVRLAVDEKISIITGGPGTGKTTIIRAIIYILAMTKRTYSLCAPTGRASKRISETCGCEAHTIHRLLEFGYAPYEQYAFSGEDGMQFNRDGDNPLEADVVIADEMSMTDILLFSHLLEALRPEASLVLVGDGNQLPPVGPGNVLNDLLGTQDIPKITLDKIFRQSEESLIVTDAHRIKDGLMPRFNESDFIYVEEYAEAKIPEKIIGVLASGRADLHELFLTDALQILTPYKKGPAGTHELNVLLQSIVNGSADAQKAVKTFEYTFREGDKVMQTKNDYQMKWQNVTTYEKGQGIFNGEMGEIKYINLAQNSFSVLFGGEKFATYAVSDAESLILAYAVTIHKSQGCEFDSVIIPLYNRNPRFLTRNLIYTAVTRAKKSVIIVGDKRVLQMMIKNNDVPRRMSALTERICDEVSRQYS